MTIADKGLELVTVRVILVSVPPKLARIQEKRYQSFMLKKPGGLLNLQFTLAKWIVARFEILNHKFPNLMSDLVSDINCMCMFLIILTIL